MKKAWMIACALFFLSAAAFAQTPSHEPLSSEALAAILGPSGGGSWAPFRSQVLFASRGGVHHESACNATAQCQSGTVSCSGSSSCTTSDSDCFDGWQGAVTCDGHTTYCTACNCNSFSPPGRWCCQCGMTDDCVSCCRCGGGTLVQCALQCG